MAQSLFNFNNLTIALSSPPPLSTQNITLSSYIQGVTKAQINYSLLLAFTAKPFKVKLQWDPASDDGTTIINDVYTYDSITDPLSTLSPLNSALSYYIYTPKQSTPQQFTAVFTVYYENGIIHYFNNNITMIGDNIIDLNLNTIDIQNTFYTDKTTYNVVAEKGNVVFNLVD
jgi:hypothetical protein